MQEKEKGTGAFCRNGPPGAFAQKEPVPFSRLAAALAGLALGMGGPFAIQYVVSGPGVFDCSGITPAAEYKSNRSIRP